MANITSHIKNVVSLKRGVPIEGSLKRKTTVYYKNRNGVACVCMKSKCTAKLVGIYPRRLQLSFVVDFI